MAEAGAGRIATAALVAVVTLMSAHAAVAWQGEFDPQKDPSPARVSPSAASPSAVTGMPVNEVPIARGAQRVTRRGGPPLLVDLAARASDVETPPGKLVFALTGPEPRLGGRALTGAIVTYTYDEDAAGTDSFAYTVTDGGDPDGCTPGRVACAPASSATAEVAISIERAPPPTTGPDLTFERGSLELAAAAGDGLTVRATVANRGTVSSPKTRVWAGAPALIGSPVRVPVLPAGSEVEIVWTAAAPRGDAGDGVTLVVAPHQNETDVTNNTFEVLTLASDDGSFSATPIVLAAALAVVLAAFIVWRFLRRRPDALGAVQVEEPDRDLAAPPGPGLGDLMDRYLGDDPAPPLWEAGHASYKVFQELDDSRSSPFLATALWRAVLETHTLREALEAAGASDGALVRPDVLLVPHAGGTRYDLVVFDPAFPGSEPSALTIALPPEKLAFAWGNLAMDRSPAGDEPPPMSRGALRRVPPRLVGDALRELAEFTTFGIVVVSKPEPVLTTCPSPAWAVGCSGEDGTSTAGVVAVDAEGRTGVTVAAHAIAGCDRVLVDGRRGNVVSTQPVQDSAFVEVELDPAEAAARALEPLRGMTPRQNERAEFDGLQSGMTSAHVSGWDPTILTVEPYVQNKITTDAVTMPGDSGAALVDANGSVLGFSFYVTGMSYAWPFSCWIWAESVFLAHGLHPLKQV